MVSLSPLYSRSVKTGVSSLGPLELHGFNYRLSAAQLACRIDPVEVAVTVGMKFRAPMRLVELLEEYLSSSVPRGHVADVIDELIRETATREPGASSGIERLLERLQRRFQSSLQPGWGI